MQCSICKANQIEKGRAMDGRRAYRCQSCGNTWTSGHKGKKRYSSQRPGYQFANTGAARQHSQSLTAAELAWGMERAREYLENRT